MLGTKATWNSYLSRHEEYDESCKDNISKHLEEFPKEIKTIQNMFKQYLYEKIYIKEMLVAPEQRPEEKKQMLQRLKKYVTQNRKNLDDIKEYFAPETFEQIENYFLDYKNLIRQYFYIIRYRKSDIERIECLRRKLCFSSFLSTEEIKQIAAKRKEVHPGSTDSIFEYCRFQVGIGPQNVSKYVIYKDGVVVRFFGRWIDSFEPYFFEEEKIADSKKTVEEVLEIIKNNEEILQSLPVEIDNPYCFDGGYDIMRIGAFSFNGNNMILSGMALDFAKNKEDEFHRKLYEVSRIFYEIKEVINKNNNFVSRR